MVCRYKYALPSLLRTIASSLLMLPSHQHGTTDGTAPARHTATADRVLVLVLVLVLVRR